MPPLQSCKKIGSSLLLLALLAAACARKESAAPGDSPNGEFGTVVLALMNIPGDVQCVRITVTGNSTVARTFPVTPGQMNPPPVVMSGLPLGMATVYEEAYNVPCASLDATATPTWVAQAPVPVTLAPNTQAMVTIILRRPGGLQVGMDYQEGGGLTIMPAAANFGDVAIGASSPPVAFAVINTSSTATPVVLTLSGANAGEFSITSNTCAAPVPAGGSCTFQIVFLPASAGAKVASATASSPGAGSVTASLTGNGVTGGSLSIAPAEGAFGNVPVGQGADFTFTVSNVGSTATGPIAVALSGVDVGHFQINQNSCLAPLSPSASCTVLVRFQPGSSGARTAFLLASASPGGSVTVPLTGTGLGAPLTISPTSQDFGAVTIGDVTSPVRTFTVTNNSALTATVTANTIGAGTGLSPDPNDFLVATACPSPIPPGGSCMVTVRYVPDALGAVTSTAALIVNSIIGGTPFAVTAQLSGTRVTDADIDLQFNDNDAAETQHLGTLRAGTPAFLSRTIINNGQTATGPLILNIGGANAAEFTLGAGTCGSVTNTTTTLAPGATCTVILNHTSAAANLSTRTATLTVTTSGRGGTSAVLTLLAVAVPAAYVFITPNPADLGAGFVGLNPAPVTFTVTNVSGAATAPLVVAASHPSFNFITNNTCPPGAALANGATCSFSLQYQPQVGDPVGFLRGTVTVTETAGAARVFTGGVFGRKQVDATFTSTPPTLVAGRHNFGSVVRETQSADTTFTLTNVGERASGAITITKANGDPTQFITGGTCMGAIVPVAGTCTLTVRFAPAAPGALGALTTDVTATPTTGNAHSIFVAGTSVLTTLLNLSPGSANFGGVPVGSQSAPTTFTVTNRVHGQTTEPSIVLTGADSANFLITSNACSNISLPGGSSCTFSVVFAPGAIPGARNAVINVSSSTGSGATSGPLTGTGVAPGGLNITPNTRDFGSVVIGTQSPPFTFTVTNGGVISTPPLSTSLSNTADFVFTANTCAGTVLAPGASCTTAVAFAPSQPPGAKNGMLTVFSGELMAIATLLGSATQTPPVNISPSSANFGSVPVGGQSNPVVFTITNPAASPPTIPLQTSIAGADASFFTITGNGCAGISLAPGASCSLAVVFAAGATPGDRTAFLHVVDGLYLSAVPLAGTSVAGTTLSITPSMMVSNLPIGSQTGDKTVTITNTGNTASGPLNLTLTGMDPGQWLFGNSGCLGAMLMPGASCTHGIRFVPTNALGSRSASLTVSAGGGPISAALTGTVVNWLRQDVGAVGIPGTYNRMNGEHTIEGGGADIYGTNDAFHYLYHPVSGDVTITARVKSIEATNPWSKAEVMIRASTASNSQYMGALVPGQPSNGYRQQYRTTTGASALTSGATGTGQPGVWLRVSRQGNTFTTSYSTTGGFFQPLGTSVTMSMPPNVTVGLGVTSHTTAPNVTLATAVFDQVTITTTP